MFSATCFYKILDLTNIDGKIQDIYNKILCCTYCVQFKLTHKTLPTIFA